MTKKNTSKKTTNKGNKGGISIGTPEVVGAVTGAAIGGMAGLMLANQKTRDSLATVKDKAIEGAGTILENVNVKTSGAKSKIEDVSKDTGNKINKNLPKNIK